MGVGCIPRDHEEPVPLVMGAEGGSGETIPRRIVPARGKVPEDGSPQAAPLILQPLPLPRNADSLAREAPADQTYPLDRVRPYVPHVGEALGVRPVCREHGSPKRVRLRLPPDRPEAGALEPKLEPADAREERADRQHSPRSRASSSGTMTIAPGSGSPSIE